MSNRYLIYESNIGNLHFVEYNHAGIVEAIDSTQLPDDSIATLFGLGNTKWNLSVRLMENKRTSLTSLGVRTSLIHPELLRICLMLAKAHLPEREQQWVLKELTQPR